MLLVKQTPAHIITGFLGAGKTTFFNACLAAFLHNETWAILVNEIGKIGIDEQLLDKAETLTTKQISGGCICCTSQLPLRVAVATLLKKNQPKRLWIEPTGLAHPAQLVSEFGAPHWQSALTLQSIITLINAHQWQNERYRHHTGYQAHVIHADIVIINRFDTLSPSERLALSDWIKNLNAQAQIIWQAHKHFSPDDILTLKRVLFAKSKQTATAPTQSLITTAPTTITPDNLPDTQVYYYHTQDDYTVIGWRMAGDFVCDVWQLGDYLKTLPSWIRIKAVVHSKEGWMGLNFTQDSTNTTTLPKQTDNCLEVILDQKTIHEDKLTAWGEEVQMLFTKP